MSAYRRIAKAAGIARWVALAAAVFAIVVGIIGLTIGEIGSGVYCIGMSAVLACYWFVFTMQARSLTATADAATRRANTARVELAVDITDYAAGILDAQRARGERDTEGGDER